MNWNYVYRNVNEALPHLMDELLVAGQEFGSRAGKTKELTFVGIRLDNPGQREIVVPGRKASIAAQIAETMWVLAGRNDIAWLTNYLPRAADFSDDGQVWRAGYGPRLRNYHGKDQMGYVVETLRGNPSSRQAVATIWDPTVDTTPGKDLACNNWLTFSCRNDVLDLMVGIRSNDAMWGWSGINAFEWSVLLEVVAGMCSLEVGALHFAVTSFHLYEQHWEKAERLAKETSGDFHLLDSPRFNALGLDDMKAFDWMFEQWFEVEYLIRKGHPGANQDVDNFPEPMLQSWLRVLQWYWSGDQRYLEPLQGTRLEEACLVGMKPAGAPQEPQDTSSSAAEMITQISALHAEKHAAYGDSWKKRGEAGILGNIARKVDRIGSGVETTDETKFDTAADLLVYLAKYRCWLNDQDGDPADVDKVFAGLVKGSMAYTFDADLDRLFSMVGVLYRNDRITTVDRMLGQAYTYALSLW